MAFSPWAALASLAVLTTSMLVLGYVSSSFLKGAAYEYDDHNGPDVEAATAAAAAQRRGPGYPPVLAYYISGGHGDCVRMTRLLKTVYHPRNRYLLHLDAGAGAYERARLASYVRSEQVFVEYGNVQVVGKGDPVDGRSASAVAAVLRAASVLTCIGSEWDWLVTLGASDYPLVTQDGERNLSRYNLPTPINPLVTDNRWHSCLLAQTFSPLSPCRGTSTSSIIGWIGF